MTERATAHVVVARQHAHARLAKGCSGITDSVGDAEQASQMPDGDADPVVRDRHDAASYLRRVDRPCEVHVVSKEASLHRVAEQRRDADVDASTAFASSVGVCASVQRIVRVSGITRCTRADRFADS